MLDLLEAQVFDALLDRLIKLDQLVFGLVDLDIRDLIVQAKTFSIDRVYVAIAATYMLIARLLVLVMQFVALGHLGLQTCSYFRFALDCMVRLP